MTSTYNDIRSTIESRIATEMAKLPTYPVSYENVSFVPPNNTPWLQVFVRFGDNSYATILSPSTGFNRQNGVVTVNVFTSIGAGTAANLTIAERIKDLFDRQVINNVHFDAASGPAQIALPEPAAYFQTQLTITFEAYLS